METVQLLRDMQRLLGMAYRGTFYLWTEKFPDLDLVFKGAERNGDTVRIELEGRSHEQQDKRHSCWIVLDMQRKRIDPQKTTALSQADREARRYPHPARLDSLERIITFPFALLQARSIIAAKRHHEEQERVTGISRAAYPLLRILREPLEADIFDTLVEALQWLWSRQHELERQVTLLEAIDLLRTCHVKEVLMGREQHRSWHDSDGEIASGHGDVFVGPISIQVLGSSFEGREAALLWPQFQKKTTRSLD